MENKKQVAVGEEEAEEARAQVEIWQYVFGFTPMAVVKCALELRIPDVLEAHGGAMTHSDLSAALGCSPSVLRRIMRYLVHRRIFSHHHHQESSLIGYSLTPLSRLLLKYRLPAINDTTTTNNTSSLAPLLMFESSPVMLAPWHRLSARALDTRASPFAAAHGGDIWAYVAANPSHSKLLDDAMSCHASLFVSTITQCYPEAFQGLSSVVDVGGGDGTALRVLTAAFPAIRGINLDLPHVVSEAPPSEGIEHVAGDMFQMVPKADAAFLMWVLHDWNDEECIQILSKCREAIPKGRGKVIVAEAVISDQHVSEEDSKYEDVRLALDMVMLAHTETGKERTLQEWDYVIKQAGFTSYTVKHIESVVSIIEAYP
ncbi:acetylserotonin O-methyltransferase-like [Andrographis paniculata]|uniref:acetylserotonin O-methyltransferase-like n=1 Tax=Andrographis paniculata TaxID=175694 RepID=UPI0021E84A09|nr:acetylserotonin O-methyltransferase-like [Andrographis paniculata]